MEPINDDNDLKWPSITLLMMKLKSWILQKKMPAATMQDLIFNKPIYASIKYDGTNVGIDTDRVMYGRNKKIAKGTKSYQKSPLTGVHQIDANLILDKICESTEIKRDTIDTFVVYGELMCNSDLYNYSTDKIDGTYQIFGAVIKPKDLEALASISEQLIKGSFAMRHAAASGDDDLSEDEDTEGIPSTKVIAISMNQTYKDLLLGLGYPIVPTADKVGTLFDVVMGNYDWMVNGKGEGLILSMPAYGEAVNCIKWKIGAEKNQINSGILHDILLLIDDDKPREMFGDNTERAIEFFKALERICDSPLVMGAIPVVVVKTKGPQAKKNAPAKVNLTAAVWEKYGEPVKSAKTKFDHADVYFAKGQKGLDEYIGLIDKECLTDIKIDAADEAAIGEHTAIVTMIVKMDFIEFKKTQGGGKGGKKSKK